ncbi:hypothetical protein N7448_009237 [Penicillium atrosanguineum]|uniref:Uncharacterized protein n=1 Tax=Penicillium atrosanguineum TaxID=1132637 RepID=A0A9W9GK86_9EURO|nr:uncharacterized protein N7443_006486 [Penicillium atrosanguineum]KAJ5123140.1 hypothetical protein N7448_009237 [Penicillium atrosanguineum]KAJ5141770.1 hypothetical protein N7526_002765 [Penicillium atrosanguineum]KAJ5298366.1 hypothetical protein N7443_006486 [Penicillium atrosanguineum]KAJ5321365.1 hypothetical protein N7476_004367 [Penicillium atrosanguineum]
MGYTHYYEVLDWESPEWKAAWPQLVKDAQTIIDAAGVAVCGATEDEEVVTPPIANEKDGIYIGGVDEDAYERFILVPNYEDVGSRFQFCKTARREYDVVVTCILLRAKMLAPNSFKLSSDGSWSEWKPARDVYQRIWPDASVECPFKDDESEVDTDAEVDEDSEDEESSETEDGSDDELDTRLDA